MTGKEVEYIAQAVHSQKISGNGEYTQKCHNFFRSIYHFPSCLLTTSCSDALEMAALLLDIKEGDEVIVPSYTFVSTANAFVRQGARIVFCDSRTDHPGLDERRLEELITPRTKAIVPVHYAGVACEMDILSELSQQYGIAIIEDAAHSVESYYTNNKGIRRRLGGIGDLGTFSFHETKNIISGEGGLLIANNPALSQRAEVIWEKGTNRAAFFRGEVDKYGWVDVGSSFLPSEIIAAFLWAQLENMSIIQAKRVWLWHNYFEQLSDWASKSNIALPAIPAFASVNGHMFYVVCRDTLQRDRLQEYLNRSNIKAVTHYISLHSSTFYKDRHDGRSLPQSDRYTNCLLRLPLYYTMNESEQQFVIDQITKF